tara:strand:- start:681 stop:905 length:225 start_codon:yes stop_codon:yes gene_type:complete
MPAKKSNSIDKAKFGRKYYNVCDTYSNKVFTSISEQSSSIGLTKDQLNEIYKLIIHETAQVKNWGLDQLNKTLE